MAYRGTRGKGSVLTRMGMMMVAALAPLVRPALARDLSAPEQKLVAEAVTKDFRDPAAAQFRWLPGDFVSAKEVTPQTYCGMVNGKNAYGAYTGFVPFSVFLAVKDGKVILAAPLAVGSSESSEYAVLKTCMDKGIDPREAR
jgi:hypothetical protein